MTPCGRPADPPLERVARNAMEGVEEAYRRLHRLRRVGPVLLVGEGVHRGRPRRIDEHTVLRPGDPLGVLHFDNRALSRARRERGKGSGGLGGGAFLFARLFLEALDALAEEARRDPRLADVPAYHGITWIPPRGEELGFVSEPLPDGWRTTLRRLHFRLLLRVFGPGLKAVHRRAQRLHPHAYWLSRTSLLENFGRGRERR
jgi:hypothetical protein